MLPPVPRTCLEYVAKAHEFCFPRLRAPHQVSLNQLALAPVTITVVFAWNMALTGQLHKLRAKYESDFFPTMRNGWKFWVRGDGGGGALKPGRGFRRACSGRSEGWLGWLAGWLANQEPPRLLHAQ